MKLAHTITLIMAGSSHGVSAARRQIGSIQQMNGWNRLRLSHRSSRSIVTELYHGCPGLRVAGMMGGEDGT